MPGVLKVVIAVVVAVVVLLAGALIPQSVSGSAIAGWAAFALFFVVMTARWLLVSR